MRLRLLLPTAATALLITLAGCSGGSPEAAPAGTGTSASSAPSSAATEAVLSTASTSLGDIVVAKDGLSVYMFDKDTKGATTSACTGECLAKWPPVLADSDSPSVDGVTGTAGTIATPDGKKQVTLGGWPLYYFAADKAAGDVTGQGVGKVWWVLTADGQPKTS